MRKAIAKAITWRLIGTAEIFAISFWTTGHIATAGHTAGVAAISSIILYVAHELAWNRQVPTEGAMVLPFFEPTKAEGRSSGVSSYVDEPLTQIDAKACLPPSG